MVAATYPRRQLMLNDLGKIRATGQPMSLIKHEGVYMFGGVFDDSESSTNLNDKLYFLPVDSGAVHRWSVLKSAG